MLINLPARTLVGRAPTADLSLRSASVSWEHAALTWRGAEWEIRDLGSVNGTFIDDQRLGSGSRQGLQRGARIAFGELGQDYSLTDDSPPQLFARRCADGVQVVASAGVLGLPSPQAPLVQVMYTGDGRWISCSESGVLPIEDGQQMLVSGERWELFLPILAEETQRADGASGVAQVAVTFLVSRDEETVRLELQKGRSTVRFEARAHNYLLLYLARRRLSDARLPEAERGWVTRTDLAEALRLAPEHLNVQLFRLRRSFAEAGVVDPGNLIESRQCPNQLRLGFHELRIRPL